MNGGGASDMGGDLNLPMNATEYMTAAGLHALIRDPKSVRFWPGMKMQGWSKDLLSDSEIDAIIVDIAAYRYSPMEIGAFLNGRPLPAGTHLA